MSNDDNYHAEFNPSGADTWMVCSPSLAMQRGLPNKSSDYANEGTDAHSLFADCLTLGVDAKEFLGDVLALSSLVTDDFVAAVQVSVNVVREHINVWEVLGYTVRLEVEQRVPIGHLTDEDGAEGTADVTLIATKDSDVRIEVFDLKFGQGVEVSAVNNRQEKMYALGAIKKFDLTPNEIELVITQPRISETPSEWKIEPAALDEFAFEIGVAAAKARAYFDIPIEQIGFEEFTPGEKQCRFCKAKAEGICHGFAAYTEQAIGQKFETLEEKAIPTYTEPLTITDLGALFPKLEAVEMWAKAIRGKISALLAAGVKVPNAKLVKGRKGARKWADEKEAEALFKSLRLKHDQMYDYELTSPTVLEKTLKASPGKWKKVALLIVQGEAGNTVVLESDPRQEVVIKPVAEKFEVVIEDNENEDLI